MIDTAAILPLGVWHVAGFVLAAVSAGGFVVAVSDARFAYRQEPADEPARRLRTAAVRRAACRMVAWIALAGAGVFYAVETHRHEFPQTATLVVAVALAVTTVGDLFDRRWFRHNADAAIAHTRLGLQGSGPDPTTGGVDKRNDGGSKRRRRP